MNILHFLEAHDGLLLHDVLSSSEKQKKKKKKKKKNTNTKHVHEKTNNLGSDQVQHKPDCTVTEDG